MSRGTYHHESSMDYAESVFIVGKTEPWRFVVMSNAELLQFIDVMIKVCPSKAKMHESRAYIAQCSLNH